MTDLDAAIRRWLAADPDPLTRAAGEKLLAENDRAVLSAHFGARLEFGTAGLRAELGPGPNRMNRAMVRWATAGVVAHLLVAVPDAKRRGVVVGFDGRHGSRPFAKEAAAVLAGAGVRVMLYDDTVPTPQLGHAVRWLDAAGGIMVTASHNPPRDNGYKVFWADGAQIVPPHDEAISAAIDALGGPEAVTPPSFAEARKTGLVGPVPLAAEAAYVDEVLAERVYRGPTEVRIVYTAMHGVARRMIEAVLDRAGHTDRHLVAEQADPDPDFPTVAFPNPEEKGALDLALARARATDADVVIANDPDGDRLAAAVPDGRGGWRALTGNEVGVLLADELLRFGPKRAGRLVATTIVSTGMLARIAAAYGVGYVETLTGFKWIAAEALRCDAAGGRFVFGFEEALGYSIGPVVRDKDGVSAALVFCDLVARCKQAGQSVLDRLASLYRVHGLHATRQQSLTLPGAEGAKRILRIMAALRQHPPTALGGTPVARVRDLLAGEARVVATGEVSPIRLPASDVLAFDLEDGSRVLARPSGTEPKIKLYFEVRAPLAEGVALTVAEADAVARLDTLRADLLARVEAVE